MSKLTTLVRLHPTIIWLLIAMSSSPLLTIPWAAEWSFAPVISNVPSTGRWRRNKPKDWLTSRGITTVSITGLFSAWWWRWILSAIWQSYKNLKCIILLFVVPYIPTSIQQLVIGSIPSHAGKGWRAVRESSKSGQEHRKSGPTRLKSSPKAALPVGVPKWLPEAS